jgi:glycosyltransferase involved in cell wall biosynthesis
MKAKVLHILEATTGGTRRHLVDLVTHLDASRYEVSVICSTRRDPSFARDIELMRTKGVTVSVIQMYRAIRPIADLVAFFRIRAILKQGYDVVHTHSSKAGFLGRLAAATVGTPLVVHTPHVFPFQMMTFAALKWLYSVLERLAARWANVIICVSPQERDAAHEAGLADNGKLRLIENGVALPPEDAAALTAQTDLRQELGVTAETRIIGTVGRCTKQKGQPYLIRAAGIVAKQRSNVVFFIVGDGQSRAAEKALVRRLGLENTVLFLDPRDELDPFFGAIDVFVMPSLWEGLPYALLEAMGHGLCVVATRVGGMEQAVADRSSGVLIPPGDTNELARAIVELLDQPDTRRALGMEARKTISKRFLLDDMVSKVEQIYEGALENTAGNH